MRPSDVADVWWLCCAFIAFYYALTVFEYAYSAPLELLCAGISPNKW